VANFKEATELCLAEFPQEVRKEGWMSRISAGAGGAVAVLVRVLGGG